MANPSIRELVDRIRDAEPRLNTTRLVLIDGPAGAGKSSLGTRLLRGLGGRWSIAGGFDPADPLPADVPAQLLHGDDMYEGWTGLAELDSILVDQVIAPLAIGDPGGFRMWNWMRERRTHTIPVPARDFLLIEGVGVASRAAREFASLTIYIDAPADVRLKRGIERDGIDMLAEWQRWQITEARHLKDAGMPGDADVIIDGTQSIPDR